MDTILWICMCMLACIGIACMAGDWLYVRRSRKRTKSNYRVITLYDNPEEVEARLNQALLRLSWNGPDGTIVLVDMGMGDRALAACKKAMAELYGSFFCTAAELPEMLRSLDRLMERRECPHG